MQTHTQRLNDVRTSYPLSRIAPPDEILFLDIETTGFSAKSSYLYMIGCLYYENDAYHTIQWFADTYEEEDQILSSFFRFSKRFKYLVHYNGAQFDLPYLSKKIEKYQFSYTFDDFESIDIYKRIAPYKLLLSLENLKQKTIETYLKLNREDLYNGGQLISVYHEYVKTPTRYNSELLLLHNFEDLKGMLQILPILSYYDLFHTPLTYERSVLNEYEDIHGVKQRELLLTCDAPLPLPVDISYQKNNCRIMSSSAQIKLRIPLLHQELKYFLPNHREYYYLPMEDTAIHKSVAAYVDRNHRIPATPATCYTKKEADFLPQWQPFVTPEFKNDYKDKVSYFCFEKAMLDDSSLLEEYAQKLLFMFIEA